MQDTASPKPRKSTKAQVQAAYDHFFWHLRDFQGGTAEEQKRGAARAIEYSTKLAEEVASLMANPSAHVLKDSWLMEAATVSVPRALAALKERHEKPALPANVIPFPL